MWKQKELHWMNCSKGQKRSVFPPFLEAHLRGVKTSGQGSAKAPGDLEQMKRHSEKSKQEFL